MTDTHFQRLRPEQARTWLAERPNALLLDAREARHHATSHLAGCTRLDGRNHEPLLMRVPKSRPVLIYCYHGNASQTYASMFSDFGFTDVVDVVGGWAAIDRQGQLQGPQQPADVLPGLAITSKTQSTTPHAAVPSALAAWLFTEGFDAARPEAPGQLGNTPLMHAAWRGAIDAVATLLDLGANPHLVSQDDFSALDMAASRECLQLLRAATRDQATPSTVH